LHDLHDGYASSQLAHSAAQPLASNPASAQRGRAQPTISLLKADWWEDYERWQKRDLSARHIVYVWADGVYVQPRMDDKQCVLVLIGADEWGKKEMLGLTDGYRKRTQS